MAFYYDKYWRKPHYLTGHLIAFRRTVLKKVNFNLKLKYGDDSDFDYRAYKVFRLRAFYYDYREAVLVSTRRIKTTGLIRYVLGFRIR